VDRDPSAGEILFPAIEPYDRQWLAADAGHAIYHEQSGNPEGLPVLFLHGGPGSRTRAEHRRYFDPRHYRIVLFDQRGCGLSTPAGATCANTTQHLVGDIEGLRRRLGVRRWVLFGGSWGSTLALAYAEAHPDAVAALVLRGVFLGSRDEIRWYLEGMKRFIPEAWTQFAGGESDILGAYHRQVCHPDPAVALPAARRWYDYEARTMTLGDTASSTGAPPDDELLARVRVQVHYLANDCFLRENALLDNLWRIPRVPAILVQGRQDMVCPPSAAIAVARGLPGSELQLLAGAGHSASQPAMAARLCDAAARIHSRLTAP
jgi:proline iminopeptidase